jgi:hypothetical protein
MTLVRKGFPEADEEFSLALQQDREGAEERLHARLDERHRHDPWPSPIFAVLPVSYRQAPTGDPANPPSSFGLALTTTPGASTSPSRSGVVVASSSNDAQPVRAAGRPTHDEQRTT